MAGALTPDGAEQPAPTAQARVIYPPTNQTQPEGIPRPVGAAGAPPAPPAGGATNAGVSTTSPYANAPAAAPGSAAFQRPNSGLEYYTGFDMGKEYDLGKSAKGTFLHASGQGVNDLRWRDKATAAAWFDQYARPELEARGFKVGEVRGDKAFVHTAENPEGTWIDWVQGIDGDNPMLAWQDESYTGVGGAGAPGAPGAQAPGTALTGLGGDPSNPDFYPKLLAHLMTQLGI